MIARLMSLVCFLGLVGCAELDVTSGLESRDGALDSFEVSQDRLYLAVPTGHQFGLYTLFFQPVTSSGQIEPCRGAVLCQNTVSFGVPGFGGREQIFRTGPSGIQYRIMSYPANLQGPFAFTRGVQNTGISESTITSETQTFVISGAPGVVHVIGFNLEASAGEIQDVKATMESRYGAAASALTYRSVDERPIVCEQRTVAQEVFSGRPPNCRLR